MRATFLTIYGIGFFLGWAVIGWIKEKNVIKTFNKN